MKTAQELKKIADKENYKISAYEKILPICIEEAKKGKYEKTFQCILTMPKGYPSLEKSYIAFMDYPIHANYLQLKCDCKNNGFYFSHNMIDNYKPFQTQSGDYAIVYITIKWGE